MIEDEYKNKLNYSKGCQTRAYIPSVSHREIEPTNLSQKVEKLNAR